MPIDHMQNKLVQQQLNNEQVSKNLNQIDQLAKQNSIHDLIAHLKQWRGPNSLVMTNTLFWSLLVCAALLTVLLMIFAAPFVFYILVLALIGFAFYKKASNKRRNSLCDQLAYQALEEKYQLGFNQNALAQDMQQLFQAFPLFDLGNYENEISQTAAARWRIAGREYPITLFQYHYVDKEERRDSEGRTSTSYSHYDRWGIFVGELPVQGITISTSQKSSCRLSTKWTTSDIAFNRRYQLSGQSEIALAKFFTPSRVLLIDQVLADYQGDFYIHPHMPVLCWMFKKDIFTTTPSSYRADHIPALIEILENIKMDEYEQLHHNLSLFLEKLD